MVAPRALTPAEEKKIAQRYAKGEASAALATEFGVHRSTVVTAVRRNGGELRKAGGSKPRKTVTAPVEKAVKKVAAAAKAPKKTVKKAVKK